MLWIWYFSLSRPLSLQSDKGIKLFLIHGRSLASDRTAREKRMSAQIQREWACVQIALHTCNRIVSSNAAALILAPSAHRIIHFIACLRSHGSEVGRCTEREHRETQRKNTEHRGLCAISAAISECPLCLSGYFELPFDTCTHIMYIFICLYPKIKAKTISTRGLI